MTCGSLAQNSARCAILALMPTLGVAQVASAERVTHQFRGTVATVSDGSSPGTIDLTGSFSVGQTLQLTMTVEQSTTPEFQDPYRAFYSNSVSRFGFTLGSYVCIAAGSEFTMV